MVHEIKKYITTTIIAEEPNSPMFNPFCGSPPSLTETMNVPIIETKKIARANQIILLPIYSENFANNIGKGKDCSKEKLGSYNISFKKGMALFVPKLLKLIDISPFDPLPLSGASK